MDGQAEPVVTQAIFDQHKDWICTRETMVLAAKNAIYLHCLPCDRGFEVANDVIDKTSGKGWLAAAFDEAENRLHSRKPL